MSTPISAMITLIGSFGDHHRFLLARMVARFDQINTVIAAVDTQIQVCLSLFADAADRLTKISGIGSTAALFGRVRRRSEHSASPGRRRRKVGGDHRQFDARIFQELLYPVSAPRDDQGRLATWSGP